MALTAFLVLVGAGLVWVGLAWLLSSRAAAYKAMGSKGRPPWASLHNSGVNINPSPTYAKPPAPRSVPPQGGNRMRKIRLVKRHGYWHVVHDPRNLPAREFHQAIEDLDAAYRWAETHNRAARWLRKSLEADARDEALRAATWGAK